MFKHYQGVRNPKRVELLMVAAKRYQYDGLNSIGRLRVLGVQSRALFTHVLVDVGKPQPPPTPPPPPPKFLNSSNSSNSTYSSSSSSSQMISNLEIRLVKLIRKHLTDLPPSQQQRNNSLQLQLIYIHIHTQTNSQNYTYMFEYMDIYT